MNSSSNIFKKTILVCIVLALFFPIIQNNFYLFYVKELKGFFNKAQDVKFSSDDWMSLIFQEKKEKFLNDNFGFRESLVRLNNQQKFLLFKHTTSAEAVFGKEGYFFGLNYLKSYLGEDFIGVDSIIHKCLLIKDLQNRLQKRDQIFLPILAPNKLRVLNNYVPDGLIKKSISNYEIYKALFDKLKIKHIDFNAYFCNANPTTTYPLYSKYGTHWSHYGHTVATDSIIKYLNYHHQLNIPSLVWDSVQMSDVLRDPDNDIVDGMNLFVDQLPSEKMAYPMVSFKQIQGEKPSLFVIGDSYQECLAKTDFQNQAFSNYKFLYYFREVFPFTYDKLAIYKINLKREIDSHKVILLITGEFNMTNYGWGFLEKATSLLNGKIRTEDLEYENVIMMMKYAIRNDKDLMAKIKAQSEKEKLNFDSLMTGSAVYLADAKIFREPSSKCLRIKLLKERIKNSPDWMGQIIIKAKERNISVDSMTTLDAIWMADQSKK